MLPFKPQILKIQRESNVAVVEAKVNMGLLVIIIFLCQPLIKH